jgi:hypothetical protein
MKRCEHHVPSAPGRTLMDGPLPPCPNPATVLVSGYLHGKVLACCDDCAARLAEGSAHVTTEPISG